MKRHLTGLVVALAALAAVAAPAAAGGVFIGTERR